jgi:uncharacterized protein YfdQ (DUF2303 family)
MTSTTTPAIVPGFDATAVADLGRKAAELQIATVNLQGAGDHGLPETVPVVYDPKTGQMVQAKNLFEPWRTQPERRKGTAKALTLSSFIDLVQRHKMPHSVVFADTTWQKPNFVAVFDYHPVAADTLDARFGQHRARYDFPLSDEWQAWLGQDGKPMAQGEFAEFLEDRIRELATPTEAEAAELEALFRTKIAAPNRLVELARGLQINVEAKVKNVVTLQSGAAQIAFEESHRDAEGKPLEVPGLFLIEIAPFFGGATVRVPVRLRYRVSAGRVSWILMMVRPDWYVTQRVRDDLAQVRAETALEAYEGAPEMSA